MRMPGTRRRRARAVALVSTIAIAASLSACAGTTTTHTSSAPPRPAASARASATTTTATAAAATTVGAPAHVVIVVLENHSFDQVAHEPFLAALQRQSAVLTDAHAVSHPSEPNYLALWSGSTQGLTDDSCPHRYSADSLGKQLLKARMSVSGYFESMPSAGYLGCSAGAYARKHNPLADFAATAGAAHNRPMTSFPAKDLAALPRVALVVPNLNDDMHDGSVAAGDAWLRRHVGPYARWAQTHDSLLIVTWDENDRTPGNRILTLVAGQHVRPGRYAQHVTHVNVLHTVERVLGLRPLGPAAAPVSGIWR